MDTVYYSKYRHNLGYMADAQTGLLASAGNLSVIFRSRPVDQVPPSGHFRRRLSSPASQEIS